MSDRKILLRLRIEFIAYILLAALLVCFYEFDVFPKGTLAGNTTAVYVLECVGIMLTVIFIPLALKSFHLALQRIADREEKEHRRLYVRWNEIRLAMFVVVVLINISVYYVTSRDTCGYCAIIGAIASLFCWPPTQKGLEADLTPVEVTQEVGKEGEDDSSSQGEAKPEGQD